jgi:hypothetical protein
MTIKDLPDLYRILQVDPSADPEVIEAVYRRLARKYHPDVNPSADANRQMQDINMAYEVLGDPEQRLEYDRRYRFRRGDERAGAAQHYHPPRPTRPKARRRYGDDVAPGPHLVSQPDILEFGSLPKGIRRSAVLRVEMTQCRNIRGRIMANQSWISINSIQPPDCSSEAVFEVTVDTTHLRDGIHHFGSVTIESLVYGGLTVPITVYVHEEPRPQLRVEPQFLPIDLVKDGQEKAVGTIHIWDESGLPMSGSLHIKPGWLRAATVDFEEVTDLEVDLVANATGLRSGQSYSGRIEVHATNGRATVLVKAMILPSSSPLPDSSEDGAWSDFLAQLESSTDWERAFLQTISLQARQRGWKPSGSQRAILEGLWRRHLEKSC